LRGGVWRHGRLSSTLAENANNGAIAPRRLAGPGRRQNLDAISDLVA
jgi:hypothetical protein